MKKECLIPNIIFALLIICSVLFTACISVKHIVYFENLQKDTTLRSYVNTSGELKIRKNDFLSINIVSPAPDILLFNAPQATSGSIGISGSSSNGYLVDSDGNIIMYKLGVVHVDGLTRLELKQKLQKLLFPYLNESVVTIRFLSNRITVLGEVTRPQVLSMPNEQISLLEVLAQSGDLTFAGRRDNILVIRETPAGKQLKRLNLSDNSIFYSPFYYLKPDDVVYVEPNKGKIKNNAQTQQTVNYALTGVSILITILSFLRR